MYGMDPQEFGRYMNDITGTKNYEMLDNGKVWRGLQIAGDSADRLGNVTGANDALGGLFESAAGLFTDKEETLEASRHAGGEMFGGLLSMAPLLIPGVNVAYGGYAALGLAASHAGLDAYVDSREGGMSEQTSAGIGLVSGALMGVLPGVGKVSESFLRGAVNTGIQRGGSEAALALGTRVATRFGITGGESLAARSLQATLPYVGREVAQFGVGTVGDIATTVINPDLNLSDLLKEEMYIPILLGNSVFVVGDMTIIKPMQYLRGRKVDSLGNKAAEETEYMRQFKDDEDSMRGALADFKAGLNIDQMMKTFGADSRTELAARFAAREMADAEAGIMGLKDKDAATFVNSYVAMATATGVPFSTLQTRALSIFNTLGDSPRSKHRALQRASRIVQNEVKQTYADFPTNLADTPSMRAIYKSRKQNLQDGSESIIYHDKDADVTAIMGEDGAIIGYKGTKFVSPEESMRVLGEHQDGIRVGEAEYYADVETVRTKAMEAGGVYGTKGISKDITDGVRDVLVGLGVNIPVILAVGSDVRGVKGMKPFEKFLPPRDSVKGATYFDARKSMATITFQEGQLNTQNLYTIFHEVGHVFGKHVENSNAVGFKAVKDIFKAYGEGAPVREAGPLNAEWQRRAKAAGMKKLDGGDVAFHEWFADQFARWSLKPDSKVESIHDTFFKNTVAQFRQLWNKLKAKFYMPEEHFEVWMDAQARRMYARVVGDSSPNFNRLRRKYLLGDKGNDELARSLYDNRDPRYHVLVEERLDAWVARGRKSPPETIVNNAIKAYKEAPLMYGPMEKGLKRGEYGIQQIKQRVFGGGLPKAAAKYIQMRRGSETKFLQTIQKLINESSDKVDSMLIAQNTYLRWRNGELQGKMQRKGVDKEPIFDKFKDPSVYLREFRASLKDLEATLNTPLGSLTYSMRNVFSNTDAGNVKPKLYATELDARSEASLLNQTAQTAGKFLQVVRQGEEGWVIKTDFKLDLYESVLDRHSNPEMDPALKAYSDGMQKIIEFAGKDGLDSFGIREMVTKLREEYNKGGQALPWAGENVPVNRFRPDIPKITPAQRKVLNKVSHQFEILRSKYPEALVEQDHPQHQRMRELVVKAAVAAGFDPDIYLHKGRLDDIRYRTENSVFYMSKDPKHHRNDFAPDPNRNFAFVKTGKMGRDAWVADVKGETQSHYTDKNGARVPLETSSFKQGWVDGWGNATDNHSTQQLMKQYDTLRGEYAGMDKSELAVFDARRIKSADLEVFDSDGKWVPLNERFNTDTSVLSGRLGKGDSPIESAFLEMPVMKGADGVPTQIHTAQRVPIKDFDFKRIGSNERATHRNGLAPLGPGIYFADNRRFTNNVYGKRGKVQSTHIADNAFLIDISSRNKLEWAAVNTRMDAIARELGYADHNAWPSKNVSPLSDGRGAIGELVKLVGRERANELLVKHGIDGATETLPSGVKEYAIYNKKVLVPLAEGVKPIEGSYLEMPKEIAGWNKRVALAEKKLSYIANSKNGIVYKGKPATLLAFAKKDFSRIRVGDKELQVQTQVLTHPNGNPLIPLAPKTKAAQAYLQSLRDAPSAFAKFGIKTQPLFEAFLEMPGMMGDVPKDIATKVAKGGGDGAEASVKITKDALREMITTKNLPEGMVKQLKSLEETMEHPASKAEIEAMAKDLGMKDVDMVEFLTEFGSQVANGKANKTLSLLASEQLAPVLRSVASLMGDMTRMEEFGARVRSLTEDDAEIIKHVTRRFNVDEQMDAESATTVIAELLKNMDDGGMADSVHAMSRGTGIVNRMMNAISGNLAFRAQRNPILKPFAEALYIEQNTQHSQFNKIMMLLRTDSFDSFTKSLKEDALSKKIFKTKNNLRATMSEMSRIANVEGKTVQRLLNDKHEGMLEVWKKVLPEDKNDVMAMHERSQNVQRAKAEMTEQMLRDIDSIQQATYLVTKKASGDPDSAMKMVEALNKVEPTQWMEVLTKSGMEPQEASLFIQVKIRAVQMTNSIVKKMKDNPQFINEQRHGRFLVRFVEKVTKPVTQEDGTVKNVTKDTSGAVSFATHAEAVAFTKENPKMKLSNRDILDTSTTTRGITRDVRDTLQSEIKIKKDMMSEMFADDPDSVKAVQNMLDEIFSAADGDIANAAKKWLGKSRDFKPGRDTLDMFTQQEVSVRKSVLGLTRARTDAMYNLYKHNDGFKVQGGGELLNQAKKAMMNLRTADTELGRMAAKTNFGLFMAGNMSSMIQEVISIPWVVSPMARESGLGFIDSFNVPKKAIMELTKQMQNKKYVWDDQDHSALLRRAGDEGLLRHQSVMDQDVLNVNADMGASNLVKGLDVKSFNPVSTYYKVGTKLYSIANKVSATATLVTGWEAAKRVNPKGTKEQWYQSAVDFHARTNGAGGRLQRPTWLPNGTLGQAAWSLQSFSHATITNWVRWIDDGYMATLRNDPAVSKPQRKAARKAANQAIAMTSVGMGIMGFPMVGALNKIIETMTGLDLERELETYMADDDDPTSNAHLVNFGMRGAMYASGMPFDLQSRLAVGGVFAANAYDGFNAGQMFGPLGSIADMTKASLGHIKRGEMGQGIASLMPTGLKRAAKLWAGDGQYQINDEIKLDPTFAETAWSVLGFTPQRLRQSYEMVDASNYFTKKDGEERFMASKKAVEMMESGNVQAARKYLRDQSVLLASPHKTPQKVYEGLVNKTATAWSVKGEQRNPSVGTSPQAPKINALFGSPQTPNSAKKYIKQQQARQMFGVGRGVNQKMLQRKSMADQVVSQDPSLNLDYVEGLFGAQQALPQGFHSPYPLSGRR